MNGFREELLTRILGLNGHMTTYAYQGGFTDFDPLAGRIMEVDGIVHRLTHGYGAGDRGLQGQCHLRPGAGRARQLPGGRARC